jgi:hypothetical protein
MPLVYPDFNIASLLYLKRIRTGLFYDYAVGTGNYYYNNDNIFGSGSIYYHNYQETFKSFGFELMADFFVLRIPYMISAGVQSAWNSVNESPFIEFLFNINIFGKRHM